MERRRTWKYRLDLLGGSLLFCALAFLAGEAYCRLFLDISFHGTSEGLFVKNAFGKSTGNAKNAKEVSFGAAVYTDEHGFRIDPSRKEPERDSAVLILGDSVAFGVGVDESATVAGLFRRRAADVRVYNSAVIGYAIPNYRDVVEVFLPRHPEIRQIYLFYCLNDLSDLSGAQIRQALAGGDGNRVQGLKSILLIARLNDYVRERSKLYLFVVDTLTDPSRRIFRTELAPYDVDDGRFEEMMRPILDIDRRVRREGIGFVVFVMPYEMQLRTGDHYEPQRKLTQYFQKHGVAHVDLSDRFRDLPEPKAAYLFGDPMHFSSTGHRILFDALWEDWQQRVAAREGPPAGATPASK